MFSHTHTQTHPRAKTCMHACYTRVKCVLLAASLNHPHLTCSHFSPHLLLYDIILDTSAELSHTHTHTHTHTPTTHTHTRAYTHTHQHTHTHYLLEKIHFLTCSEKWEPQVSC